MGIFLSKPKGASKVTARPSEPLTMAACGNPPSDVVNTPQTSPAETFPQAQVMPAHYSNSPIETIPGSSRDRQDSTKISPNSPVSDRNCSVTEATVFDSIRDNPERGLKLHVREMTYRTRIKLTWKQAVVSRDRWQQPNKGAYEIGLFPDEDVFGKVHSHPETHQDVFEVLRVHGQIILKIICRLVKQAWDDNGGGYPDIADQSDLVFPLVGSSEPYDIFMERKRRISEVSDKSDMAGQHATFTLKFLEDHSPAWRIAKHNYESIAFEDLSALYPPKSTVFMRDAGGWRALKIGRVEASVRLNEDSLRVFAYHLGFDKTGMWLIPQLEVLQIEPYSSRRSIDDLMLLPDWYVKDKYLSDNLIGTKSLPEKLIDRGESFFKYQGRVGHREYEGDAWPSPPDCRSIRVIVDMKTTSRHVDDVQRPQHQNSAFCAVCVAEELGLGPYPREAPHDFKICLHPSKDMTIGQVFNNRKDLMFCPSRVWAFSLWHKTWKEVPVDDLKGVTYSGELWKKILMYKERTRKSLDVAVSQALGKGQENNGLSSSDTTNLKGQGLKILLHGGPGTGKTMTAECLAEKIGVPFYQVTLGEMGTEPETFDRRLRETFTRAANWGAILLVEGVDCLLQDTLQGPSPIDLSRNALRLSLLYHLEYSDTLVFLTASLPADGGASVMSMPHIHFSIPFYNHNFKNQKEIWRQTVDGLHLSEQSRNEVRDFIDKSLSESRNMNGREIRNCVRAALALAQGENNGQGWGSGSEVVLTENHIRTVLELGDEFKAYMKTKHDEVNQGDFHGTTHRMGIVRNLLDEYGPRQV